MYTLFLDDIRSPTRGLEDVKLARNSQEAVDIVIKDGVPKVISFDYNLGYCQRNGSWFMKWLFREHRDGVLDLNKVERVIIHSSDLVYCKELKDLWDNNADFRLSSGVTAEIDIRHDWS